jgi:hypothetical protein
MLPRRHCKQIRAATVFSYTALTASTHGRNALCSCELFFCKKRVPYRVKSLPKLTTDQVMRFAASSSRGQLCFSLTDLRTQQTSAWRGVAPLDSGRLVQPCLAGPARAPDISTSKAQIGSAKKLLKDKYSAL